MISSCSFKFYFFEWDPADPERSELDRAVYQKALVHASAHALHMHVHVHMRSTAYTYIYI